MGEQSNAYRILLRYDRKSRHRRIKKQRRYERLAATSQFRATRTWYGGVFQTVVSQTVVFQTCVIITRAWDRLTLAGGMSVGPPSSRTGVDCTLSPALFAAEPTPYQSLNRPAVSPCILDGEREPGRRRIVSIQQIFTRGSLDPLRKEVLRPNLVLLT